MSGAEASIPPGRLARLIRAAAVRADAKAIAELRAWAERDPEGAKHKARFDSRLEQILADFTAEPGRG